MRFFSKPKPEPTIDRRGIFRRAVDLAIRDAISGYESTDWPLYRDVANDLEQFARQVPRPYGHVAADRVTP